MTMARDTIAEKGGRTVLLRPDVVARVDALAESADLVAPQGRSKGKPDRPGVIAAAVELVLEDASLRARLRTRVAPQVQEIRQRAEAKAARRARSGGKRGRPRIHPRPDATP